MTTFILLIFSSVFFTLFNILFLKKVLYKNQNISLSRSLLFFVKFIEICGIYFILQTTKPASILESIFIILLIFICIRGTYIAQEIYFKKNNSPYVLCFQFTYSMIEYILLSVITYHLLF